MRSNGSLGVQLRHPICVAQTTESSKPGTPLRGSYRTKALLASLKRPSALRKTSPGSGSSSGGVTSCHVLPPSFVRRT